MEICRGRSNGEYLRFPLEGMIYLQDLQHKICLAHNFWSYHDGAETEGRAKLRLPQIDTYRTWQSQLLIPLMLLSCACRQDPSPPISWEASSSSWWSQMDRPTTKRQAEPREVKDTTRRPAESITLGLWGLNVHGHLLGSMQELDVQPLQTCSKLVAWCSCGSPNKWKCHNLCAPAVGSPFPQFGLPDWVLLGEDVPRCPGV